MAPYHPLDAFPRFVKERIKKTPTNNGKIQWIVAGPATGKTWFIDHVAPGMGINAMWGSDEDFQRYHLRRLYAGDGSGGAVYVNYVPVRRDTAWVFIRFNAHHKGVLVVASLYPPPQEIHPECDIWKYETPRMPDIERLRIG